MSLLENCSLPIPNHSNYEITQYGLVTRLGAPIMVCSHKSLKNYVSIRDDSGRVHRVCVARLVAETYLGRPNGRTVGFIDGNVDNYNVSNLYWTTRADAFAKIAQYKKQHNIKDGRMTIILNEPVYQLNLSGEIVRSFANITEVASHLDVPVLYIRQCCNNPSMTCCHYKWCYASEYGG